jgi:hypothetical protein
MTIADQLAQALRDLIAVSEMAAPVLKSSKATNAARAALAAYDATPDDDAKPVAWANWSFGEEYDKRLHWIDVAGDPKGRAFTPNVRWRYLYYGDAAREGSTP